MSISPSTAPLWMLPHRASSAARPPGWTRTPAAVVLIEGHCDERGTAEYNIALGERRAEAAKAYLVNLGIADARLKTVSYGEEKPVDDRPQRRGLGQEPAGSFRRGITNRARNRLLLLPFAETAIKKTGLPARFRRAILFRVHPRNGVSMKKTILLMLPVLLLDTGWQGVSVPQRIVQMDHRLSSLERQVQELSGETDAMRARVDTALGTSDQSLRSRAAGLAADISRLDEEIQLLRGRVSRRPGMPNVKRRTSVESLRASMEVELGQLRDQLRSFSRRR
jgi:hypothetical protein